MCKQRVASLLPPLNEWILLFPTIVFGFQCGCGHSTILGNGTDAEAGLNTADVEERALVAANALIRCLKFGHVDWIGPVFKGDDGHWGYPTNDAIPLPEKPFYERSDVASEMRQLQVKSAVVDWLRFPGGAIQEYASLAKTPEARDYLLQQPNWWCRVAYVHALQYLRGVEAPTQRSRAFYDEVDRLLGDPDERVRLLALLSLEVDYLRIQGALGEQDDELLRPVLLRALRDSDSDVRLLAASYLRRLKHENDKSALKPVAALFDNSQESTAMRAQAAMAVIQLNSEEWRRWANNVLGAPFDKSYKMFQDATDEQVIEWVRQFKAGLAEETMQAGASQGEGKTKDKVGEQK